jgi:hypothetical protein
MDFSKCGQQILRYRTQTMLGMKLHKQFLGYCRIYKKYIPLAKTRLLSYNRIGPVQSSIAPTMTLYRAIKRNILYHMKALYVNVLYLIHA